MTNVEQTKEQYGKISEEILQKNKRLAKEEEENM